MFQHKRFVASAIHQCMSNTEIECRDRLQKFRKLHERYLKDVAKKSDFFVRVWYAQRALDSLVVTFQALIDSIEDTDEKDRVVCEYQPRIEELKRKFSDDLESLRNRSGGGNHPLGVPRTNPSILYRSFSPESTIEERLEEFDFVLVRAWDDCTTRLVAASLEYDWFHWHMEDTQKAWNNAKAALEKLFDGIDDPEETKRLREEYKYFIWLVKSFATEREKFPWSKQSASNFNRALVQERLPWKP